MPGDEKIKREIEAAVLEALQHLAPGATLDVASIRRRFDGRRVSRASVYRWIRAVVIAGAPPMPEPAASPAPPPETASDGGKRRERVPVLLTREERAAIDDWRYANRYPTRSDAIRAMTTYVINAGLRIAPSPKSKG